MNERCENCRFWKATTCPSGTCRRHAPIINPELWKHIPSMAAFGHWPITEEYDFCGEYQHRDNSE